MPKKSEFTRGNKSDKAHSPMKDRTRKPARGEASYDGGDHEKKDHEMKPNGGNQNPFGGVGKSTDGDEKVFDDIRNLSRGNKSKNGCFPKLFMLLLSIVAGAAYFFLGL